MRGWMGDRKGWFGKEQVERLTALVKGGVRVGVRVWARDGIRGWVRSLMRDRV